ncbi:MAG: glycosyltransferase [Saprospiraceae bacterium]
MFDINLVYRPVNVEEYKNVGGRNVHLWMPYYIPWEIDNAPPAFEGKPIDVIFIGHWEKHREETIQFLSDNGIKVDVYGNGWEKSKLLNKDEIKPLYGKDYFGYLKSAKIALAFLSKLNRDVYTRRNFEIPACGTVILSERTNELENIFKNDQIHIGFFSSNSELKDNLSFFLENYNFENFKNDHSIDNRIQEFINIILL